MRIAILCNDRLGIPALQQLVQNRLVVAAGTSDRSMEMISVMNQITNQAGVPHKVFARKNIEENLSSWLSEHKPDVVLVKTFPYKIPVSILKIPKFGFINFHYAPLPKYKGSNPLFWMIKNQVTMGGIAVHQMDENFDTGPLLMNVDVPIAPGTSFGMHSTQLAYAGAQLTGPLIHALHAGNIKSIPQQRDSGRWYGRPTSIDLAVDWNNMNAAQVMALSNACNPWLKGAPTNLKGWTVGLTNVSLSDTKFDHSVLPGTIIQISRKEGLIVACNESSSVSVDVMYTEEGYFPGFKLLDFGIKVMDRFS